MSEQYPGVNGAWHYLNEPRAYQTDGKTITSGVNTNGDVLAIQFDHTDNTVTVETLDPQFLVDEHANAVFDELSDGRMLAMWDRSSDIHYSVATDPADVTSFGSIQTYESPESNANYGHSVTIDGRTHLFYRYDGGIDYDYTDDIDDPGSHNVGWGNRETFFEQSPWSYPHVKEHDGLIYLARTGNPYNTDSNDLWLVIIDPDTGDIMHSDGSVVGSMDNLPITLDDVDMIRPREDDDPRLSNMQIDENGDPYVVYCRFQGEDNEDHLYEYAYPDGSGGWEHYEVTRSTPMGEEADTYWVYFGGITIDSEDMSRVWFARNHDNESEHEIYEATTPDGGTTWSETALTEGSAEKQLRPRGVRNSHPDMDVQWLSGQFSRFNDFDTDIISAFDGPPSSSSVAAFVLDGSWLTVDGDGVVNRI